MSDYFEKLKKSMGADPNPVPPTEPAPIEKPAESFIEPTKPKVEKKPKAKKEIEKIQADHNEIPAKEIKPLPITPEEPLVKPTKKNKSTKKEDKFGSSFPLLINDKEGKLAIDIYQTDKEIIIQSAVGGVSSENLDISIENDLVSIRGLRENPIKDEGKNYFRQECHWGTFSREIILPEEADTTKAEASIKNGILIVKIPKITGENKNKIIIEKS